MARLLTDIKFLETYNPPYPTDAATAVLTSDLCHSMCDNLICTMKEGHIGRHKAGLGSGVYAASWPHVSTVKEAVVARLAGELTEDEYRCALEELNVKLSNADK